MTPSAAKKSLLAIFFPSILVIFFISACTSGSKHRLEPAPQSNNEKGYVEFYCMRCMTGWAIFKIEGGKQTNLAQQILGRRVQDSVEMPSREKKVRIALPVGPHDIAIRLLPYTLVDTVFDVKKGSAIEIRIIVDQNRLTPVRLDFSRINNNSFSWTVKQSDPLPLRENSNTVETHTIFLNSADWDKRWYATQFFGKMEGQVPELAIARLEELSGWDALQKCLKKSGVVECESLREEAGQVFRKIQRGQP